MVLSIRLFLRVLGIALSGLIMLSACTVVVDDPGPIPGPGPGPQYCTREYQPVCARRGGERKTFANGCVADRAGYDIIRRGECGRGGGGDQPRFCTREYRPVCARKRGSFQTFGNACEADAAGWRVVDNGPCR
jgi:hypothetical protein